MVGGGLGGGAALRGALDAFSLSPCVLLPCPLEVQKNTASLQADNARAAQVLPVFSFPLEELGEQATSEIAQIEEHNVPASFCQEVHRSLMCT